ncbi:hypothetical protein A3A46_02450 [Candidatus Roizmanbacteria bacterium RIFCSPLOWO2_01_FULL_37_13]|uniref:Uncharacterized protein n=1 Tax=Candidatus Roizmanbacteria bacterium RIFCSPHIGHO2_02_FULL_38_11 TaxID=1802039 RepID=A0A1F7H451_9BACT|nr:MAG: hypothetical protein A3C25_04020 [Candidatus Roizmanbacteria bacterium RIFCSPHIGHO2_02_FULL_38_11]OGK41435.1 MAG: hypothetical protein A3A46_02450 [Candidatus Roizmanbacteria bacterium RIFCSPLOWO2_01_FULL_37_13]
MARKTKEEKRIAAYRKKLKLLQQITEVSPERINTERSRSSREREISMANEIKPPEIEKTKETADTQPQGLYFIKDLRKSLLIIFLIITLEIIIYFASIKDYLRLGL